ncbi:hypothetical protein OC835_001746 [Tilletia horrida]|nr:hypothetical protein OC835_001746 [Tilletia horrida]
MAAPAASSSATASASQTVRLAKRAMRKAMGTRLAAVPREDILAQSAAITRTLLGSELYRQARTISVYLNTPSGEVDTHELCLDALRSHKTLYVPTFGMPAAPPANDSEGQPCKTPINTASKKASHFAAEMSMLQIIDERDYLSLPINSYGIREPSLDDVLPPSSSEGQRRRRIEALSPHNQGGTGLDLIVCPGLAFDRYGGRLGHGKGYYDRYLLRAKEWALRERERRQQQQQQQSKLQPQAGEGEGDVRMPIVLALSLREQLVGGGSGPQEQEQEEEQRVPMDDRDVQLDGILTPEMLILPPATSAPASPRAPNDAKVYDPIPGGTEHVRELAEAGIQTEEDGAGWRAWGFSREGGLRVWQGGKEL